MLARMYITKLIITLACAVVLVALAATAFSPSKVGAQKDAVCDGVALAGGSCNEGGESEINSVIRVAINIFSGVVGLVAVMMMVYGGFKYVTAGGDASQISAAQKAIIYAIIGLMIVGLSQVIVRFVLSRATGNTAPAEEEDEEDQTAHRSLYKLPESVVRS